MGSHGVEMGSTQQKMGLASIQKTLLWHQLGWAEGGTCWNLLSTAPKASGSNSTAGSGQKGSPSTWSRKLPNAWRAMWCLGKGLELDAGEMQCLVPSLFGNYRNIEKKLSSLNKSPKNPADTWSVNIRLRHKVPWLIITWQWKKPLWTNPKSNVLSGFLSS